MSVGVYVGMSVRPCGGRRKFLDASVRVFLLTSSSLIFKKSLNYILYVLLLRVIL